MLDAVKTPINLPSQINQLLRPLFWGPFVAPSSPNKTLRFDEALAIRKLAGLRGSPPLPVVRNPSFLRLGCLVSKAGVARHNKLQQCKLGRLQTVNYA